MALLRSEKGHGGVKLDRDFGGVHAFLNDPYPSGPNPYFERIEANLERLRQRL